MNNFLASKLQRFSTPFSNITSNSVNKNEEPKLEYEQNDNLISKEESIKRIFWLFQFLAFLKSCILQFLIIFVFYFSKSESDSHLLSYEIPENMYQPYLHILYKDGAVDICELKITKESKFIAIFSEVITSRKIPLYFFYI